MNGSGQVKRNKSGRILRPWLNHGYEQVSLCKNGITVRRSVHDLVAAAFLGPKPKGFEVNHINGNRSDNRACNLEYVTRKENNHHGRYVLGHNPIGSKHGRSKITEEIAMAIYKMRVSGKELTEVASTFGVSVSTVSMIASKKIWRHIH